MTKIAELNTKLKIDAEYLAVIRRILWDEVTETRIMQELSPTPTEITY